MKSNAHKCRGQQGKVTIGRLLQAEARDEVRHAAQIWAFWAGRRIA
jgi:phage FluMu gp28-like protein